MQIGIIGRAKSGKTTLFNALTGGTLSTSAYSPTAMEPNIGVARVPDRRQDELVALLRPGKVTLAEVRYMDVAIPRGKGRELGGELLVHLSRNDAFLNVVRVFEDEAIPHPDGSIEPGRDMAGMELELAFVDLGIIERRLARITETLRGARAAERDSLLREQALLSRIGAGLEGDLPVREQSLTDDERKIVESYQFLTAKPVLVVFNLGEDQLDRAQDVAAEYGQRFPRLPATGLCAKLEMELGQLDPEEAVAFRMDLGTGEPARNIIIRRSFALLDMITFFTTASNEVRAWTVKAGITAVKAAGKIHTDMERGFIRAEVIHQADLLRCGGYAEARRQGLLRLEGKNYAVQDGDVITFLFNV